MLLLLLLLLLLRLTLLLTDNDALLPTWLLLDDMSHLLLNGPATLLLPDNDSLTAWCLTILDWSTLLLLYVLSVNLYKCIVSIITGNLVTKLSLLPLWAGHAAADRHPVE